jgi:thymidylate kinase
MIISFSGIDGSGKTTILQELYRDYTKRACDVCLVSEFDFFFLRVPFLRRITSRAKNTSVGKIIQAGSKRSIFQRLIPYVVWLDVVSEYWYLRIFRKKFIVMKDRQAFDYLLTWIEKGLSSRFVYFLYTHAPKPDISFFIDADPMLARERRILQRGKTKNKTFFLFKSEMYRDFFSERQFVRLYNAGTVNESVSQAKACIEKRKKFEGIRSVALSGIDGAGKSTTIERLDFCLSQLGVKRKTIHFYYRYIPIKIIQWVFPDKQRESERMKRSVENEENVLKKGKSRMWVWFVILDALAQYWLARIIYPKRLLVFDRFFYDYLVSFDFIGAPYNKRLLLKLFPKVDRYFVQIAEPDILHKRKPEHTEKFFHECHGKYENLAKDFNLTTLDSSNASKDDILEELLEKI